VVGVFEESSLSERTRPLSDPGDLVLASLAQAFQFLAAATLAGLFIVCLAAHFLAKSAPLTKLAEAANRLLNGLTGTNP
jgi:hypothetical protein